jgi:hypothetical protein
MQENEAAVLLSSLNRPQLWPRLRDIFDLPDVNEGWTRRTRSSFRQSAADYCGIACDT